MPWINILLIQIFVAQDNLVVTQVDKIATRNYEEKMCDTNFNHPLEALTHDFYIHQCLYTDNIRNQLLAKF